MSRQTVSLRRRRAGRRVFRVEADEVHVAELLIAGRFLRRDEEDDVRAIERALADYIAQGVAVDLVGRGR